MTRRDWLAVAACVLLCFLVALDIASQVVSDALCCADDSYFAITARNVAIGLGYAHSYPQFQTHPGERIPFDPGVTIGPALVYPVAAAIRVFGAEPWVPGAATAVLIAALFLAAIAAWLPLFDRRWEAIGVGAVWLAIAQLVSIG